MQTHHHPNQPHRAFNPIACKTSNIHCTENKYRLQSGKMITATMHESYQFTAPQAAVKQWICYWLQEEAAT